LGQALVRNKCLEIGEFAARPRSTTEAVTLTQVTKPKLYHGTGNAMSKYLSRRIRSTSLNFRPNTPDADSALFEDMRKFHPNMNQYFVEIPSA
jgi:hypothetical protein